MIFTALLALPSISSASVHSRATSHSCRSADIALRPRARARAARLRRIRPLYEDDKSNNGDYGSPPPPPAIDPADDINYSSPCSIKVIGIGGGGGNTVNRMISFLGSQASRNGVEFWSINTDVQALSKSLAENRIQIGPDETKGLGAGSKPEVGKMSAEESLEAIEQIVRNTDMVFVTAGMGGGTGSGAAPVVAQQAKQAGCLTVGIVTKPFHFEGRRRLRQANDAIEDLRNHVDILIVVSNDKLLEVAPSGMALNDAFACADDILRQGIVGISEIITKPGLINVDFADVNSIMSNAGLALMGIGEGAGPSRARDAALAAITSPLLDFPLRDAKGVVYTITGGPDMSLTEVNRVAEVIAEMVHPAANVIFGANTDESMGDKMKVVVVATNFESGPLDRNDEPLDPGRFKPGSAGFMAFGPGSDVGNGIPSNTFSRSPDPYSDHPKSSNQFSQSYYESPESESGYNNNADAYQEQDEEEDDPKQSNKDLGPKRGLGGWWYWWRN